MILGHLPFSYVLSRLAGKHLGGRINSNLFVSAGVLGGIFPDFDMLYFHLVDQRQHHHHTYWTHLPIFWVGLILCCAIWYWLSASKIKASLGLMFAFGGFVHLLLDSIVGDIWWLYPFLDEPFALFTVPAIYQPWWLNFILHWSFALELAVIAWAIIIWQRNDAN